MCPSEILYVSSMENYVVVHAVDKKLVCKLTLEQMLSMLPGTEFLQVHRSHIVNRTCIDAIEKLNIIIRGNKIPISRDKRKEIYERLMG